MPVSPPKGLTDEQLHDAGWIRVPIGPFGLFGTKVMSLKKFQREENRKERANIRAKRQKANRRKRYLAKKAKRALAGKKRKKAKKKSQGKNLGFGLYWK